LFVADGTTYWGDNGGFMLLDSELFQRLLTFTKEIVSPLNALMLPYLMLGVAFRTRRFAKEGFHDMISISINMFIPSKANEEGYALAVRTLREAPLKDIFFDEGALDSLKVAASKSCTFRDDFGATAFHFVDMKYVPEPDETVRRFREYCASKLSDLFGTFQALSAMRVGPIVTRCFCWVMVYENGVDATAKVLEQAQESQRNLFAKQHPRKTEPTHHSASNKFRLLLIELEILRHCHLKQSNEIPLEWKGEYFRQRWEMIQKMQSLFDLATGMPNAESTVLCGSVVFTAPVMTMVNQENVLRQEEWSFAPWESW
jgi:hypothetical protein